MDVTKNME